jgi:hypothetical protein
MINKLYKRIHNKYSTLFKFIFFLRYLFGIFFISIVLFLAIPHFFDLKKKDKVIKNYLLENYGIKLSSYDDIDYHSLPLPSLNFSNVGISIGKDSLQINANNLIIYPKLISIYNFKNFETNKIILKNNKILIDDSELKILIKYIYNLKNRLTFKNLDLKINRQNKPLINIKKINFSNYGYEKNLVKGELFDKKFKILINNNYNKINFKFLKTGITVDINLNEIKKESTISGILKSKLLNSKLKFNFDYDGEKIKIYNSYFRNKNLSLNNESLITYRPFLYLDSIFQVEDINIKIIKKIDINRILTSKNLIKKINAKNTINFKSKIFSQNLIDDLYLNVDLAYGRLVYFKKISISENFFSCKGDINLLEEYPILHFDCLVASKDKKKLLKKFSIKYKIKNEPLKLNVKGNINILNNKINFKKITMNQNYVASKEDLNYFKQSFETIVFDKNFSNIFNLQKIKKFILEIN